ncbi:MAG: ATP-grasp domain-containing protein [Pseudomonadota bacterium]
MTESNYLIVATSGRAIAQGLKALEHSVVVIDGFADQDTIAATHYCKKIKRSRFGLDENEVINAINKLSADYTFSGLFYDAAIEINPHLLNKINIENIIGNSIETLQRCKDPHQFFPALKKHSIPFPDVRFSSNIDEPRNWLAKNHRSTGGLGVKNDINEVEYSYLQKFIQGTSFSLTFLANAEDIQVLGANTQWHKQLGDAIPYAYAGAINQTKLSGDVLKKAMRHTHIIAEEFDLVGLNSVDFISHENEVYVLEVNPRIPASYELYETKRGDLMREHILSCRERKLPTEQRTALLRAHAILYAPNNIKIPDDMKWPLWTADRPHAGEDISQFEPICNVFSGGKNYSQVCEMIATRKKAILNKLTT